MLRSRIWQSAKRWRRLSLGSLSLIYRFGRNVRVSNNSWRHLARGFVAFDMAKRPSTVLQLAATDVLPRALTTDQVGVETALIVGAGPGLGHALARRLAAAGMQVMLASRRAEALDGLVAELAAAGGSARAYGCDASDESSVKQLMRRVCNEFGMPNLVVYAVQGFNPGRLLETEVAAFEESWRQNCLGGFIVAREAGRLMTPLGRGSIILIGSTSSLIGRADHLNLAVGKFGLRAIAQVLAREIGSAGVHIAHVVIDADIQENDDGDPSLPQSDPSHLADAILTLHRQPRSAWTSEMDFRPWNEAFWEHC